MIKRLTNIEFPKDVCSIFINGKKLKRKEFCRA